jgi:hypothetical protein
MAQPSTQQKVCDTSGEEEDERAGEEGGSGGSQSSETACRQVKSVFGTYSETENPITLV